MNFKKLSLGLIVSACFTPFALKSAAADSQLQATPVSLVWMELLDDPQSANYALDDVRILQSRVLETLANTRAEFSRLFRFSGEVPIIVRLVSEEQFRARAGRSHWSNAVYHSGQITLLVSESVLLNPEVLSRRIRHEYAHAVLEFLSGGHLPIWLEEGLASVLAGGTFVQISSSFRQSLTNGYLPSLESIEQSFLGLDYPEAERAYALSMFAVRSLINRHGFSSLLSFLEQMRSGDAYEKAFSQNFHRSPSEFDQDVRLQLGRWLRSDTAL